MEFKSDEERHFAAWLQEANLHGLVSDIKYEPMSYPLSGRVTIPVIKKLKTKTKIVDKFLLHPHSYTPDFEFIIHDKRLLSHFIKIDGIERVTIDTKGTFLNRGAKQEFSINRKWMFSEHGIYVNKIVPFKLFQDTWCPDACRLTPRQFKLVKKYVGVPTINEFMEV